MLLRLSILLLFALSGSPLNAATLKGAILADELGGKPMANVQVTAADGANPTVSDSFGRFTLDFPRKQPGDPITVLVSCEGYVVVNDVQLELELPNRAEDKLLYLILCRSEDREEMARRFYRLRSFDAIEQTYQKRLKELEDTQQATAAALTKLQQERDQAKTAAEKASEALAKSQPGQSSELYQEAKRLFVNGKIEEAIQLLDDEKLRDSVAEAQKMREEAERALQNAVQAWLLKGQLLTVQFHFDGAETAYLAAINAAPESFDANFAFARFSQELNRYEKARKAYERCLEWARKPGNDAELALTLNNLGVLDSDQNRLEEARNDYGEALKIYRELAQRDPQTYLPSVARTLNNLGILDREQNRSEEARTDYSEGLKICRELAQKKPDIYLPDVATTLNNLGVLDSDQKRREEARKDFEEALQIRRELAQKNPGAYLPFVAATLNNLGILERAQKRLEAARNDYTEALKTYRELTQKNPETYLLDLAATLNNLGGLDKAQNRPEEAWQDYTEALKTYRELARKNPETYLVDIARALDNLGGLERAQNKPDDARKNYEEALQIRRGLAQKNHDAYLPDVAETLNNLGVLDRDQQRPEEARKELQEALLIYEPFANQDPERFSTDVTRLKKLLDDLAK
ncbi:MAG: tetratricopeptide repeat protein [Chthoniobacterales bacterium]